MRGWLSLGTKIFTRLDQTAPKDFFPKSICRDSGCEWIVAIDEPVCQAEAVLRCIGGQGMQRGWHCRIDLGALIEETATDHHVRIAPLVSGKFAHDRHRGGTRQVADFT